MVIVFITQWIMLLSTLYHLIYCTGIITTLLAVPCKVDGATQETREQQEQQQLIKTLVVLMMENHSYDHFLGEYSQIRKDADGSNPSMCNKFEGQNFCVTHDGPFQYVKYSSFCLKLIGFLLHYFIYFTNIFFLLKKKSTDEPENFIPDVDQQIYNIKFGTMPSASSKPTMGGFVENYMRYREKDRAAEVMQGMNHSSLPVLYKLAEEFAISDVSCCFSYYTLYIYSNIYIYIYVLFIAMVFIGPR